MNLRLRFNVEKAEDGLYVGTCPQYPYLLADGDTPDEALEAIQDAVEIEMDRCSSND